MCDWGCSIYLGVEGEINLCYSLWAQSLPALPAERQHCCSVPWECPPSSEGCSLGFGSKALFPPHPQCQHSPPLSPLPLSSLTFAFISRGWWGCHCSASFPCFSQLFWSPVGGLGQKPAQLMKAIETLPMGLIKAGWWFSFFFFFPLTRTQNSPYQCNRYITTKSPQCSDCKSFWVVMLDALEEAARLLLLPSMPRWRGSNGTGMGGPTGSILTAILSLTC